MKRSDHFSDIREIADDVCANSATDEQLQQLEQKLRGNSEAKRFYFDYLRVHNGLKSAADRNMEIVYRRMTEEVIVRPQSDSPANSNAILHHTPESRKGIILTLLITLALAIIMFFVWQSVKAARPTFEAQIVKGQVSVKGQGSIEGDTLYSGEYGVDRDAVLKLNNGDTFELSAGSRVKLFANNEVKLKAGVIAITSVSGKNINLHADKFRLSSNGDALSVDLTNEAPVVTTGTSTSLHAERWRPRHYWSFEGDTDRVINSAGSAHGVTASGAVRVAGLIGNSAFHFNNSENARIMLGSGGGTAPATGSFSATDGVTIEALIQPNYSGERGEQDEIFRKGNSDGELRMMLGFQHDNWKDYLRPNKQVDESLSFGLYLVGQGYHELKLPLDGNEGRPTLAQMKNGNTYHIVASYDVKSGLKAMYINGELLASYQYPPGSKVLTGGPGEAVIGSNPTRNGSKWERFAYSGVIDELAFYDFALPPLTIDRHIKQVQQGINYYGLEPSTTALPEFAAIQLPANLTLVLDPLTGLPQKKYD